MCCFFIASTETLTAYRGVGAGVAAAAAAVGMVLGLGVGAARANRIDEVEQFFINPAEGTGFNGITTIPFNQLPIPATDQNLPFVNQFDDGADLQRSFSHDDCDDGSVKGPC